LDYTGDITLFRERSYKRDIILFPYYMTSYTSVADHQGAYYMTSYNSIADHQGAYYITSYNSVADHQGAYNMTSYT
jgi:hypothetical protein